MDKKLAKAIRVFYGRTEHGIMTLTIMLEFGIFQQSFGGYTLDRYDKGRGRRVGTASGTDFVIQILNLFDVNELRQINGKTVYALMETENEINPKILGLEMPPADGGRRFLPEEWQKEWEKETIHDAITG